MKSKLSTRGFVLTLVWGVLIGLPGVAGADHLPVMYVQVPPVSYTHLTLPTRLLV